MTNFARVELGKTNIQFIDGDRSSRYPKREEFVEEGVLFLNAESINSGSINKANANYISQEKFAEIKKGRIKRGDLLLTTRGNGVGNVAYVNTDDLGLINAQMLILRSNEEEINSKFLFYYFSSSTLYSYIQNFASGSAQPQIPIRDLKRIPLFIPSLKIQEKIAGILSAYDELIENNKKRIALLETMAGELYKEWFVRFRFPDYENTEFEKGIPSNWEETTLKYIANVTMGQSPSSEFYNDAGVGLPFHQGVGTYGERFPINSTFCSVEGRLAQENDILFSVRAPVGRLNIATTQSIIGRGLCAINSKNGQSDYLFYLLNHTFSKEDIIGNGAIFNSVSKDELLGFKLLKPNDEIVEAFNNQAKTINEAIRNLYDKNENLTEQKNKLLPKLISGKLSVKHLNIQQPPTPAQPTDNE